MNIWIDGTEANVSQRLGSGQVAYELLKNFERLDKKNNYTILLAQPPLDDLPKERPGWKYKILKIKKLKTLVSIPLEVWAAKVKPDLIFSPTHYIPRFSNVKKIGMIFDLSFLHFPEMFLKKDLYKLTKWSEYSIIKSAHLITISKFSKEDIIVSYKNKFSDPKLLRNKITVAYLGYDQEIYKVKDHKPKEILKKYGIKGEYIIFLGTVQPRKNLKRLIEAIQRIDNIKLVVVGKTKGAGREGWMYQDILELPKRLGIEDRVIFTGFVPNQEASDLVSNAVSFILPSLWEGFGIPPVEAMACGTPVIVANVSSLPEVVGEAGVLFDPYSVDQMEQAIRTVISDKKLRQKMIKKGFERVKQFSWDKMAKVILEVFEKQV